MWNEALPLIGMRDGLTVRLDGPGGSRIFWSLADPADGDGWPSARIRTVERLLPHLRQFVRVRKALADADGLNASLAALLDGTAAGIVQLDRRRRIVAANDRALDLLRKQDGLLDEDGFLHAPASADDHRLQLLLARALPPLPCAGAGGSLALTRPAGSLPLVLHVIPLGPREDGISPALAAALVLIVDPGARPPVDPALVQAALDLSPAQSRVAALLAEGRSVQRHRRGDRAQREHRALAHKADLREAAHHPAGAAGPAGALARRPRRRDVVSSMRETVRFLLAHAATAGERRRTGVAWNPLSPSMAQDPYPVYAVMRRRSPVHRSRLANAWLFSRHADADAILRDHRRFASDPRKGRLTRRQQAMLPPAEEFTMLSLDPPDHTRLRALVNKAFTSRAVNAMEAHIRATAAALLDEADAASGFDLMTALAQPLPVIVIAEMLGVPAEDRDRFRLWSDRRARLLEPTVSARERAVAMQAGRDFDRYFRSIVAERRAEPRDDILSALVQAEDEGERLTERETLNMLRLLVMAGNETTTNLIGNGMLALLRNPDQLRRLREDPGLIPTAVEELLRYDPPAQAFFRRALADCEVNGFELRKGDNIILLIGAANRDGQAFVDPDRLDIGRAECPHLSLSRGIHYCLGAPLARLEGRIVFETLLERFPEIELLDPRPRFRSGVVLRGLQSLPLRCARA